MVLEISTQENNLLLTERMDMKQKSQASDGLKSLTRKPFRWGEWIIEKSIASIAMAALVAIVLIFCFVFKESLVIFKTPVAAVHTEQAQSESGAQEVYGASSGEQQEVYGAPSADKQEVYGAPSTDKQESYGAEASGDTAGHSTNSDTQESYGGSDSQGQESYGAESAPLSATDSLVMGLVGEKVVEKTPAQKHSEELASLGGTEWQPVSENPLFGIWPLLWGSLKIALIAVLVGAPIAIFAALYTTTFAPKWAREFLKPAIELLAGFPSVVVGFFALVVMASFFQQIFGFEYRLNALVGGIAMSLAVIPVIYTLSEDALSTVPHSYKEASLALGAAPWETALYVVLPAALPGILAGVLLGVGRAIGETMIALMATGNAALMNLNLAEPVRTLSASIGAEMAEVVVGDMHYGVLFLLGTLLFLISFALNFAVEFFVRQYLMKKFRGA